MCPREVVLVGRCLPLGVGKGRQFVHPAAATGAAGVPDGSAVAVGSGIAESVLHLGYLALEVVLAGGCIVVGIGDGGSVAKLVVNKINLSRIDF